MLGLTPDASPDAIRAAYRARARTAHPDGGGTVTAFTELNAAAKAALDYAAGTPCPRCAGRGTEPTHRGFSVVRLTCHRCRGSGLNHRS